MKIFFHFPVFSFLLCMLTMTTGSAQLSNSRIVDLTHEFSEETVYWVTAREFDLDTVFMGDTDKGFYYSA